MQLFRDGVGPAEAAASLPASPGAAAVLAKKKGSAANEVRERATGIRSRRLMKELTEIQRFEQNRQSPPFTVSFPG